jgi:hypothetical protein
MELQERRVTTVPLATQARLGRQEKQVLRARLDRLELQVGTDLLEIPAIREIPDHRARQVILGLMEQLALTARQGTQVQPVLPETLDLLEQLAERATQVIRDRVGRQAIQETLVSVVSLVKLAVQESLDLPETDTLDRPE